jgi:hypothetical protein
MCQVIKTTGRFNSIQRQSSKEKMRKKFLGSYWIMKQKWGIEMYTGHCNMDESNGLAYFEMGIAD